MSNEPPFRISPPIAALGLFALVAIGFGIWFALQKAPPALEISEKTTVVTTPLDERGRIDYETPLNDILGAAVTPESNAMVLLTRVFGPRPEGGRGMPADWWKRLGVEEPPEDGEYLKDDSAKWLNDFIVGDNGEETIRRQAIRDEEETLSREPWKTADSPHMAEWLKANDKPLSLAADAVKRPQYFHPLIARDKDGNKQDLFNALLPYCQKMRAIASLLSSRSMWHLGEGRADAAWADVMTIHRLGGLMIQNPCSLIEYLVGVALRSVALHKMVKIIEVAKPDLPQLTRWKSEFQAKPVNPNWEKMLGVCERYMGLDTLLSIKESLENRNKPQGGGIFDAEKEFGSIRSNRASIDWNDVLKTYNDHNYELTKQVVLMTRRGAQHEQRSSAQVALNDLERSLQPSSAANSSQHLTRTILKLFIPAILKVAQTSLRIEQHTVFMNLMFDLEEHRLQHGSYPETVDQFNPPRDYFTGEPIRYKRLPNGYYLQSVGQNKIDDFKEQFGEPHHGDDIVVKMIRK